MSRPVPVSRARVVPTSLHNVTAAACCVHQLNKPSQAIRQIKCRHAHVPRGRQGAGFEGMAQVTCHKLCAEMSPFQAANLARKVRVFWLANGASLVFSITPFVSRYFEPQNRKRLWH